MFWLRKFNFFDIDIVSLKTLELVGKQGYFSELKLTFC